MLRMLTVVFLVIIALFTGSISANQETNVDRAIEKNKSILQLFKMANSETSGLVDGLHYEIIVTPIGGAFCDDKAFQRARKLAGDKTLLMIWRGEWMECYSPVSKTSTLRFDREFYSLSGRLFVDRIIFAFLSALSFIVALALLFRHYKTKTND